MTKKTRIAVRILCVLLAGLLLGGIITAFMVFHRRAERKEYYETFDPNKDLAPDFAYYEDLYYLWLWSDEEMTLLQRAAQKDELYYEIAADYVRHWNATNMKDFIDWSWLPYDLDREEYLAVIDPLLEQLYVPVLTDSHEASFDYGDIRITRKKTLSQDAPSSKISLEILHTGIDYTCDISILDEAKDVSAQDETGPKYEHFETITTKDGHDINYYNSKYNEGKLQPLGNTWGVAYVNEGQQLYFGIAYSPNFRYGYALPEDIENSTMVSYADHLENDEVLLAAVEKQWNTITLIHHGIILYGALTAATVVTLVVLTVLYQRVKKREKGSDVSE